MKLKKILMSLVALIASSLIAAAQSSTPAGDNSQPAAQPATTAPANATPANVAPANTPSETASPAPAADTTAPALATATTTAPAQPATQDNSAATNAPAQTTTATNATPDTNTVTAVVPVTTTDITAAQVPVTNNLIPLIVMDEVPLTDAIKNLARQANLNYMLDPKIPYGSVGPDGRTNPQPMVSLRWENLTADQALSAVLNNYNLTVSTDPKTRIARITVKDPAAPEPLVTKIIQLKYS